MLSPILRKFGNFLTQFSNITLLKSFIIEPSLDRESNTGGQDVKPDHFRYAVLKKIGNPLGVNMSQF